MTIPRSPSQSLAEKVLIAMDLFKKWSREEILAQLWVPLRYGNRYILSTLEQPYLPHHNLSGYREVSKLFTFAAESKSRSFLGLPGRVFISGIPEWTSNVKYYNKNEFLRLQYAVGHQVRGCIGLPIFEDNSHETSCCAVLELIFLKENFNFDIEMENVRSALKAVNLTSKQSPRLCSQGQSENQKVALATIAEALRAVCRVHELPLVLTWVPCNYQKGSGDEATRKHAGGHNSLDEKCILIIEETACHAHDMNMQSFLRVCGELYIEEGKGIVGKALQSNRPFFKADLKECHVNEYPLVHHARKFGLNGAVAIRMRCTYTGDDDYVLEFFLPLNMTDRAEQKLLLKDMSATMQSLCKCMRTVSDDELVRVDESQAGDFAHVCPQNASHQQPIDESVNRTRRKMKSIEKRVSLSVIQQHFSMTLRDAAKSIGVCPTTLKRRCRKHGIQRWPFLKIKKANTSMKMIQSMLDSVEGVKGQLKFDPISGEFVSCSSNLAINTTNSKVINNMMDTDGGDVEHNSSQGSMTKGKSSSLGEKLNQEVRRSYGESGSKVPIKASFKDDKIRFRFEPADGCAQLYEEVAKRFNLQIEEIQLKYIDDEELSIGEVGN